MGNKMGYCHKFGCKEKCNTLGENNGIIKFNKYCYHHRCMTNNCDHYGNYYNGYGNICRICYYAEKDATAEKDAIDAEKWFNDPTNPYGAEYQYGRY